MLHPDYHHLVCSSRALRILRHITVPIHRLGFRFRALVDVPLRQARHNPHPLHPIRQTPLSLISRTLTRHTACVRKGSLPRASSAASGVYSVTIRVLRIWRRNRVMRILKRQVHSTWSNGRTLSPNLQSWKMNSNTTPLKIRQSTRRYQPWVEARSLGLEYYTRSHTYRDQSE